MAIAITRVHLVHLESANSAPDGCQPSYQANWIKLWVRQYAATVHITIAIYYYYSTRKMTLILPSHGRWKAESEIHYTK